MTQNQSVVEFCQANWPVCQEGLAWGKRFGSMREAWEAFCRGEGNAEWMLWVATRPGVFCERELRQFTIRFVRQLEKGDMLQPAAETLTPVDVIERIASGEATEAELVVLWTADDVAREAAWAASRTIREAVDEATKTTAKAAMREVLGGFGNPFLMEG